MSATNIVLIGFMGSGKSSVGKLLSLITKKYFLDTDAMIEVSQGKSISDIFNAEGEQHFRNLEKDTVLWLESSVQNAIVSTGGGMILHNDNLNAVGKIVYLKVPFQTIMNRMNKEELDKRPLFKDQDKALALYKQRDVIYENKADIVVDASGSLEDIADLILKSF